MNDDYLWDGSGEPDPDIKQLETLLGRYRSDRPAPAMPKVPAAPAARPRPILPLAAIAAMMLIGFGSIAVWRFSTGTPVSPDKTADIKVPAVIPSGHEPITEQSAPPKPTTNDAPKAPGRKGRKGLLLPSNRVAPPRDVQAEDVRTAPTMKPLVDVATAIHLEQAEFLLRSFRSAEQSGSGGAAEIALNRRQSRELLNQNVLLRQAAESRHNLQAQQILGDLEPFLVDIANLDANPSTDDVAAIQSRIQRKEIVADLQLYSANLGAAGY